MKRKFQSLPRVALFGLLSPDEADVRARIARRRNHLYVRSEKLRAFLSLLSSGGAKKILFSTNPAWAETIQRGFRRLPHQVEFGSITAESFERYDIVVPLTIPDLEVARRHARLRKNALPLPSAESVRLCDDKYRFNQALIKAGFGRYIPKMQQGMGLTPPYILKKRTGWRGQGCYLIRNHADQEAQLDRIMNPQYFCQELIPGTTEFATHILFAGGRIVKALNIKYEFESDTPIKGQNAALLQVVHRCPCLDLFERILRTIRFQGLCCVNYKVAKDQPFLLEINPRFGGSLAPYFFSFVRHLR
jgi:predicted ATP-grasp superfamily ATP-dependent carboligase